MNKITSVQNELIKTIVKLHTSKGRRDQKRFLAEGQRVGESFARAKWQPLELFATAEMAITADQLFDKEPTILSDNVMKKISTASTPSGIVAVFAYPKKNPELSSGLVLSKITDPGNMGTLIRSAAAFGSKTVVIVDGCDPFSPKVVQASAGTIAHVTIIQWSWKELLENKKDLKLCALTIKNGQTPESFTDKKDLLLVVGNEAHGLSESQIIACDTQLTLPMSQDTESLNAAIAGSIALYLLK